MHNPYFANFDRTPVACINDPRSNNESKHKYNIIGVTIACKMPDT